MYAMCRENKLVPEYRVFSAVSLRMYIWCNYGWILSALIVYTLFLAAMSSSRSHSVRVLCVVRTLIFNAVCVCVCNLFFTLKHSKRGNSRVLQMSFYCVFKSVSGMFLVFLVAMSSSGSDGVTQFVHA